MVPGRGLRLLAVVPRGGWLRPARIEANRPSRWGTRTDGGDYVVIAPRALHEELQPLLQARHAAGHQPVVADVEDLYDEFAFGEKTPIALRRFLQHARRTWKRPPRFLLLVGDASFDPRNHLGRDAADLVPTKLIDTHQLETASDDWISDFDGDGVAELATGRFPVHTPEELRQVIAKTLAYSSEAQDPMVFVADRGDEVNDFGRDLQSLVATAPAALTKALVRTADAATFPSELRSQFEASPRLLTYLGHGSQGTWSGRSLDLEGAAALGRGQPTVVLAMTCLNGFFHDVFQPSLAEALLVRAPAGAVAVWASSGLNDPHPQLRMAERALQALMSGRTFLGEALLQAKSTIADPDVRRTWMLFGDPALTFSVPDPRAPKEQVVRTEAPVPAPNDRPAAGCSVGARADRSWWLVAVCLWIVFRARVPHAGARAGGGHRRFGR